VRRFLMLLVLSASACTPSPVPPEANQPAATLLRAEILARVASDQAVQREMMERAQNGQPIDAAATARRDSVFRSNLEWTRGVLAQHGWPGRRTVGEDGSHGVWLLLQHADQDLALQRTALQLLERAVAAGDASAKDFAYLTDRVRVAEGRLQLFGTQLDYDSKGCAASKPVEDPARLDQRRAAVGLEPIREYIRRTMDALGRSAQCSAQ
jgi:hypothetical protein